MKTIIYKIGEKRNRIIISLNSKILSLIFFINTLLIFNVYTQDDFNNSFCAKLMGYNDGNSEQLKNSINDSTLIKERIPIVTNVLKVGSKIFTFYEYETGMIIDRLDTKTGEIKRVLDLDESDCEPDRDPDKFRGHWSGFEIGINDYFNDNFSLNRPAGYNYLDLKTGRSWNFNFNFMQNSATIIGNHLGIVSGFGIELNRYYIENKNSIQTNDITGVIEERVLVDDYDVIKSKFNTTYLTVPIILETQFPVGSSRFYLSGGVIGGLNLSSSVKVVHDLNDKKHRFKEKGNDLNINKWRLGLTFRFGSKDKNNNSSGFYATYYLTPLFENDMGPELHPFSVGFRIDM